MSGIITLRRLGTFGRFGNAMFQYAFARAYAEKYNAVLQTPEWIGQKIFNISDPPIQNHNLPQTTCDVVPWGQTNIDLLGYFQHKMFLDIMTRSWLKKVFTIQDRWLKHFEKPMNYYIGAHVRKGDYGGLTSIFAIIKEISYINACDKFGLDSQKLIWVTEENPTCNKIMEDEGIPFLYDFLTLMHANVILRGNSTFSWWAATLSDAKIYSPNVGDNRGECEVDFIEGNWPKIANFKKWQPHCPQIHDDLHLRE